MVFISGKENRRWLKINELYRGNRYISSAGRKLVEVIYGRLGWRGFNCPDLWDSSFEKGKAPNTCPPFQFFNYKKILTQSSVWAFYTLYYCPFSSVTQSYLILFQVCVIHCVYLFSHFIQSTRLGSFQVLLNKGYSEHPCTYIFSPSFIEI